MMSERRLRMLSDRNASRTMVPAAVSRYVSAHRPRVSATVRPMACRSPRSAHSMIFARK